MNRTDRDDSQLCRSGGAGESQPRHAQEGGGPSREVTERRELQAVGAAGHVFACTEALSKHAHAQAQLVYLWTAGWLLSMEMSLI